MTACLARDFFKTENLLDAGGSYVGGLSENPLFLNSYVSKLWSIKPKILDLPFRRSQSSSIQN